MKRFLPVQYSPRQYGEYVDLYDLSTWAYARSLRYGARSGYCGIHHIAEDPFSSFVVVDAQECS